MRLRFKAAVMLLMMCVLMLPALARAQSNTLDTNQALYPNQALVSDNGANLLIMQGDGNLVIYSCIYDWDYQSFDWIPTWSSGTCGQPAYGIVMQSDCNLVIYGYSGPTWSSDTWQYGVWAGFTHPRLVLQDEGNIVIYADNPWDGTTSAIWVSSNPFSNPGSNSQGGGNSDGGEGNGDGGGDGGG